MNGLIEDKMNQESLKDKALLGMLKAYIHEVIDGPVVKAINNNFEKKEKRNNR